MVKPDGVQRGLTGDIISRMERKGGNASFSLCCSCSGASMTLAQANEWRVSAGYTLVAMKMQSVPQSQAEQHYQELSDKPFYPKLIEYITSGPVVTMVWSGSGVRPKLCLSLSEQFSLNISGAPSPFHQQVVEGARALIGSTKPLEAAPGTIRGDFAIDVGRNVVHGSDSEETAQKEISLWFNDDELVSWTPSTSDWIYE